MAHKSKIRLKVASPCTASWDQMTGDDAVRFCTHCEKNVYQLSNMTTEQVEQLLSRPGDTPCVRFFQRRDGTLMTSDCPVGARSVRRKRMVAGIGFGIVSALGYAFGSSHGTPPPAATAVDEPPAVEDVMMGLPAVEPVIEQPAAQEPAAQEPAMPEHPRPLMGKPMRVDPDSDW